MGRVLCQPVLNPEDGQIRMRQEAARSIDQGRVAAAAERLISERRDETLERNFEVQHTAVLAADLHDGSGKSVHPARCVR